MILQVHKMEEEQLTGVCEDPEHEICFTEEQWFKMQEEIITTTKITLLNNLLRDHVIILYGEKVVHIEVLKKNLKELIKNEKQKNNKRNNF